MLRTHPCPKLTSRALTSQLAKCSLAHCAAVTGHCAPPVAVVSWTRTGGGGAHTELWVPAAHPPRQELQRCTILISRLLIRVKVPLWRHARGEIVRWERAALQVVLRVVWNEKQHAEQPAEALRG